MTTPRVADLPAGFRFHPTDEELVVHYLANQAAGAPCPAPDVIAEANIYACDPWELKLMIPASAGGDADAERYFFSPRERKYPNGARPNRAAGGGYWKATGTDRPVLSSATSERVGVKKALVFYSGRPPRGVKTGWIMHEYRLTDMASGKSSSTTTTTKRSSRGSSRLDDWVLCRIYKKSNNHSSLQHLISHQEQEQEPAATLALASSPKSEALDHQATMTKSCSITDLLNTIDGCALSQMLLLLDGGGPEEVDAHDAEPLIYYPPPHKEQQRTRTISH